MDLDENDILVTNTFISKPELSTVIPEDSVEEFKNFYKSTLVKEKQQQVISDIQQISLRDTLHENDQHQSALLGETVNIPFTRKQREVKTYVNVDSRDRDHVLYPKPNNFKIFLSKTFYNVKTIKLASVEFPNTDAVINSNNRFVYWRNQEDISLDCITTLNDTINYPVYSAPLRIGSYTANSLQAEFTNQLDNIRRTQGTIQGTANIGTFHFFVVNLDINTDIVSFTSLILQQLSNNPFSVTIGSGLLTITANNHGFVDFQQIYIVGSNNVAGIESSYINGFQTIRVLSVNSFTFQVTVNASSTVIGGGNTVRAGRQAPFQLLWGGYSDTVAQNIGYALENSSQLIYTNIQTITTIYEMLITTIGPHELSNENVGDIVEIGELDVDGITFTSYLNTSFQIYHVPNTNGILVQISDITIPAQLNNNLISAGYIKFGSNAPVQVSSYTTYNVSLFMVTTFTEHNYNFIDIGNNVSLYNTANSQITNDSNYDGNYQLLQIPSTTQLVLPGVLINNKNNIGQIIRQNIIKTFTIGITSLIPQGNFILVNCVSPHKLLVGDTILFGNTIIAPAPTSYSDFIVTSTPTSTSFTVKYPMSTSIITNISYIGTGLITVSFPKHGFNSIINISQSTPLGPITITTVANHNLSIGNSIRIMETNVTPSLDNGGYIITAATSDTFTFTPLVPITLTNIPTVIQGIIGMSNNFSLYNCINTGGILGTMLNNSVYTVRTVIDINTFTFYIKNSYATSSVSGCSSVYISSLLHGYNGTQTNTKIDLLNRSINLEGENYCLLVSPQLDTMVNTGSVKNIFARITLDQAPGYVCFNFLSNPKQYNTVPLNKLATLEFSCVNHNGSFYDFNDLDYSFVLEIVEIIDESSAFNISSRRGIQDTF